MTTYLPDGRLDSVTRPDGSAISIVYDAAGRPQRIVHPLGSDTIGYVGRDVGSVTTFDGEGSTISRDGFLVTGESWTGPVAGSVGFSFDTNHDLRPTSRTLNGAPDVAYTYADADGLLTAVGAMTVTPSPVNGFTVATAVGGITQTISPNPYGEVDELAYSYASPSTVVYDSTVTLRDALGRIRTMTEKTPDGAVHAYEYQYDLADRLWKVLRDGTLKATYLYDTNGNRWSKTSASGTAYGDTDDQDRMTSYGTKTYEYTASGDLRTVTDSATHSVTRYTYDVFGQLRSVVLPSGETLEYVIDGMHRRVGKKVNGTLVQGLLYQGALAPAAELDGSGNIVATFVYATRVNVPDYMVKGGITYRLLTDHRGSVRAVVDVATGTVAQQMDYDEYGVVTNDTAPGFQPFGYAGGLYEPRTGLVRFGARDYDAETGRWTGKDPLGFGGGDANLYAYVAGDPINLVDPTGFEPCPSGPHKADAGMDYHSVTVGGSAIMAYQMSFTLDRFGNFYFGVGGGISTPGPILSWTQGALLGGEHTSAQELSDFLAGNALSGSGFFGAGGAVTNAASGTAAEVGFGTPGVGGVLEHSWQLFNLGFSW